jgi:hypothetical protein
MKLTIEWPLADGSFALLQFSTVEDLENFKRDNLEDIPPEMIIRALKVAGHGTPH